ncbi:flavin-dependent oxidoreductase [Sneathiella marina]|uniref:Flavin-dependent oxidoreductase n=1 Tax=Sneathiella marina TaxID=2950108 RepID=A0ABY4W2H9_9PROT|nr:flavin-dependent oxidoreductase [Sneathiella marina]USG59524.1 flavin-dependent oxidoreductase [Sneathiella marina]
MKQGEKNGIIVGGGLVGLTAALALHQKGIAAQVFESVEEIKPLGVGINLLPHSVVNLSKLGLLDDLRKVAIETSSLAYFSADGKTIWKEPRGLAAGYEVPQFSIHRGDFHMILLEHARQRLGAENIKSGHHFADLSQSNENVTATFIDRKSGDEKARVTGDFLIGADGINSTLRQHYYPTEGAPKYSGQMLWRGVTEMDPFLDGRSMFMAGHNDLKLVAYPIRKESATRGKSYINWIAERRMPSDLAERQGDWNELGLLGEFQGEFSDWDLGWLDIQELFENAISIHKFPMIDRDPLPKWSFERVTLMGDAAHAMYPNGSNGVSQGVLDALTFTDILASSSNITEALQAYERARLEPTSKIILANRQTGPEQVMQMVHETCSGHCGPVHSCISRTILEDVALKYKKLAGFDRQSLAPSK